MRKKLSTALVLLIPLFFFVNCKKEKHEKNKLYYLNFKDSLIVNVTKTVKHNKVIILNDSIVSYSTSKLVYEKHSPKWLFDKTEKKKLLYDAVYSPEISEIEVPYKLIKAKKANVFQVIKNTDTLLFYFQTFDKIDF